MTDVTKVAGYIILGLVEIFIGFLPVFIAKYKENNNMMQIFKADIIVVLGFGILGTALSLIFQATKLNNEVWAFVILMVIEAVRLACWIYLMVMTVKDKELPIF